MSKSPSQIVKDKFGEKTKLVDAVKQFVNEDLWVGRENKDKGLSRVSNAKLLRLLETFTTVQSKWGTRAKLIDAVVEAAGRGKDAGYRKGIEGWPVPRLYDAYKSLTAKRGKKDKPAAKPAGEKAPAAKKAAAPAKKDAKKGAAPAKKSAAGSSKKGTPAKKSAKK
jgi:hypothetical protein